MKTARLICECVARAALGEPLKREGAEFLYRCPHFEGHTNGDTHPSLKVNSHKNTWACFVCGVGGTAWELAAYLARLDPGDKQGVTAWLKERELLSSRQAPKAPNGRGPCVAEHAYRDSNGNPVARKLRFEPGANGRKKDFTWQRWENGAWLEGLAGVKQPLYRLPEIKDSPWVVLTEGEKDADAGAKIGFPTTTTGGVSSFREDHSEALRGKDVVIVSDADDPGREHAQKVAAMLYGKAVRLKVCEIPASKDLAEAIEKSVPKNVLLALFDDTPEWKPANGAEILDLVFRFVRQFVALSEMQARAVTLLGAHTHAMEAADCTPYLAITSAEKESGKSRLLEVLELLVANPWLTGRVTAAVLIRKVDAERPCLLLDESDAAFGSEKEYAEALRGVLNSGYRRGGRASCCVGQGANTSYRDFSTFCAKAIAGIGKLPDTVASRSIPIHLKRAPRGTVPKLRKREAERESAEIKARLAAWCAANLEKLRDARPEIPEQLSDRQADCVEPLLAIADLAGREWPETARRALVELCTGAQKDDGSIGVRLLADVRRVFSPIDDDGNPLPELERIASSDLASTLGEMEDRPWAEWGKSQKAMTQPQLARLLAKYDIGPKPVRLPDGRRLRGYERAQFAEAWALYVPPDWLTLPVSSDSNRDTVTTRENIGQNGDFQPVMPGSRHGSENAKKTNKNGPCHAVTAQKPEHEGRSSELFPKSLWWESA